ncbi:hypothetical protein U1Q18_003345 [Sarracenia purpurea var. burkii]
MEGNVSCPRAQDLTIEGKEEMNKLVSSALGNPSQQGDEGRRGAIEARVDITEKVGASAKPVMVTPTRVLSDTTNGSDENNESDDSREIDVEELRVKQAYFFG